MATVILYFFGLSGKASTCRAASPNPPPTIAKTPKTGATPVKSPPTKKCKAAKPEEEDAVAGVVPKGA